MKKPEGREGNDVLAQYRRHVWDDVLLFSSASRFTFFARLYFKPDKPLVPIRNNT